MTMTMAGSWFHEGLVFGSFLIAGAGGLLVGHTGGAALRARHAGRFVALACAFGAVAVAAQYGLWLAMASGSSTVDGGPVPSDVGVADLIQVLALQAVALVTAPCFVWSAARHGLTPAAVMGRGALGALFGAMVGSALPAALGIATMAGCFAGLWQCNPLMQL